VKIDNKKKLTEIADFHDDLFEPLAAHPWSGEDDKTTVPSNG
jgi:hypothetical protein